MNKQLYLTYLDFESKGLRKLANSTLNEFIANFTCFDERASWVIEYMTNLSITGNDKIHYHLFESVFFPVIEDGFVKNDPTIKFWVCVFWDNLQDNIPLYNKLGNPLFFDVLDQVYQSGSYGDGFTRFYLDKLLDSIKYSIHEWPNGILMGPHGASYKDCQIIRDDIDRCKTLGLSSSQSNFINDFEEKLDIYQSRLDEPVSSVTDLIDVEYLPALVSYTESFQPCELIKYVTSYKDETLMVIKDSASSRFYENKKCDICRHSLSDVLNMNKEIGFITDIKVLCNKCTAYVIEHKLVSTT